MSTTLGSAAISSKRASFIASERLPGPSAISVPSRAPRFWLRRSGLFLRLWREACHSIAPGTSRGAWRWPPLPQLESRRRNESGHRRARNFGHGQILGQSRRARQKILAEAALPPASPTWAPSYRNRRRCNRHRLPRFRLGARASFPRIRVPFRANWRFYLRFLFYLCRPETSPSIRRIRRGRWDLAFPRIPAGPLGRTPRDRAARGRGDGRSWLR